MSVTIPISMPDKFYQRVAELMGIGVNRSAFYVELMEPEVVRLEAKARKVARALEAADKNDE